MLNTTTGPDNVQISIVDLDADAAQTGTDASNVRVAVSPAHGAAAFSTRQSTDREVYELVVNRALLDYEAFAKTELTEADAAIYKITITAADNTTATLTDSATYDFEVKDVKFTPVFVNPQDSTPLEPAAAFVKESDIIAGPDGSPLYLLSDIRALNRIGIGSIAAVDPETNDGTGIVYRFTPVSATPTVIRRNIALVPSTDKLSSRLEVSGVGLTVGETDAVSFQASKDTSFASGTSNSGPVNLEVNNTAYEDAADVLIPVVADPAAVNITFNREIPLLVIYPETPATDTVTPLPFAVTLAAGNPPTLVTDLTTSIAGDTIDFIMPTDPSASPAATPIFGFVDSSLFAAIVNTPLAAEIASLGFDLAADLSAFSINNATGQISVNTSNGLTFPNAFTLPIYVTGATDGAFNIDTADITIVTVVITDENAAPQAMSLTSTPLNNTVAGQISGSIAENLPAGTPIASTTFILTDDNLPLGGVPTFAFTGAAADLFNVTTQTNTITVPSPSGEITVPGSVTVTVVTKQSFNYENATLRTNLMSDLALVITDAGKYTLFGAEASGDPMDARFLRVPVPTIDPTDALTAEVKVSITLTDDANEAPALEVVDGTHVIAESAVNTDTVTSSATGNVIARITNTADFPDADTAAFNSSRVVLTVTGDFADILEARYIGSDAGAISLNVVDADALENLGDGRSFTATIVATVAGLDPVSGSVQVRIRNIPANSRIDQAIIDALIADAGIAINEQDVAGQSGAYSIPTASFNVPANSLIKDADETIGTGANARPVVSPALSVGSVTLGNSNLNPQLEETNIISLSLEGSNYRLSINDADFVENALFASVSFTLNVSTPGNTAGVLASDDDSITFTQAANKSVAYANTARDSATPSPVYALSYTQTGYVEAVTNFTGIDATTITTIDADTDFTFGGAAISGVTGNYVNITDATAVYPALALVDAQGNSVTGGNFIARDHTTLGTFNSLNNNAGVLGGTNIAINVNSETDLANGLDILSTDAAGNLVDASAEFNAYFNLAVNNTAGETGQRNILITQKLFTQVANATRKYNALDTIQLYAGSQRDHTLNYFIRARAATDGATNASNYALAQFSVAVSAAGLNERATIERVALIPNTDNNFDNAEGSFDDGILTIAENSIDTNSFDSYRLLIEFSNADAIVESTVREAASMISVDIAEGAVTGATASDNTASDGQLISLRATGTGDPLTAGAVELPAIASDAFEATGDEADYGVYTVAYDFALAQNLAGSARIVVTVEEFERASGGGTPVSLGDHQIPLTLVVTPSNAAHVAAITTEANGVDLITSSIIEDTLPLPESGGGTVGLTTSVPLDAADAGAIGRTATVTFTGVANPAQTGDNPREKAVFTYVDAGSVSYNEHAWGVDVFNFDVAYTEPRGFANAHEIEYTLPTNRDVTVVAADDDTVFVSADFAGFAGADFLGASAGVVTRTGSVVFSDPDLDYNADLSSILGSSVTITSAAGIPAGAGTVTFNPGSFNVEQDAANDAQATVSGVSYSLELTEIQARAKDTTAYNIGFEFNAAGTTLTDATQIAFAPQNNNPTEFSNVPSITVIEEDIIGTTVGTIVIADPDIAKTTSGNFAYAITDSSRGVSVEWSGSPTRGAPLATQISNTLQLAEVPDDADIGEHAVTWTVTDDLADGASTSTVTGTTTFTIARLDDTAAAARIAFTATGAALQINPRIDTTQTFPISLEVVDDDFLETPPASLNSVTYGPVGFIFTGPSTVSGSIVCQIPATGTSLFSNSRTSETPTTSTRTTTGFLAKAGGDAITVSDLNSAFVDVCRQALPIGSELTSAVFQAVKVDTDSNPSTGETTIGQVTATPAAYVIQGYRNEVHTMVAPPVSVSPGSSTTFTVTITDGDPDDGIPSTKTRTNVDRTDGGSEWADTTVTVPGACAGKVTVDDGPYAYSSTGNTAQSTLSFTVRGASTAEGETCTLTFNSVGEDGQSVTATSLVTVQPAPNLLTPIFNPVSIADDDTYVYTGASVELGGTVSTSDPDLSPITISFMTNDVCSVTTTPITETHPIAGASGTNYPFTATVVPSKPGECSVTTTATEDDAPQTPNAATITFPELSPTFVATTATPSGQRALAAGSSSFEVTLTATNRDPGDDASRGVDVNFVATSADTAKCTVTLSEATGNYVSPSDGIGGTDTTVLTVIPADRLNGAVCPAITITATENGKPSEVIIAAGTFIFDGRPTISVRGSLPTVANYADDVTFEVNVGSTDGNVGARSVRATATDTDGNGASYCSVTSGDVSGGGVATITVTPERPSDTGAGCRITVIATEDGVDSFDRPVVIALPNFAPSIASVSVVPTAATQVSHYVADAITITTSVTDNDFGDTNDDGDAGKPVLTYTPDNTGVCTVSNQALGSFDSSTGIATATASVTLFSPGTDCVIEVGASEAEGGDATPFDFVIVQNHVAPQVRIDPVTPVMAGRSATLNVIATKQDPGTVSAGDIGFRDSSGIDGTGCSITPGAKTISSPVPADIGDIYSRVYTVTRPTPGTCSVTNGNLFVTENSVGSAATNQLTGVTIITFTASLDAPSSRQASNPQTPVTTVANYDNGITIRTLVTDGDPNDGARPTLSYAITSASGTCTIDSTSTLQASDFSGATATASDTVTLRTPGTNCVITATPREDGINGATTVFDISQPHLAPNVRVDDTTSAEAGSSATFNVVATKQDPGATTAVSFGNPASHDGCTLTRVSVTPTGGYNSTGDTFTQLYSASRSATGVGTCTIAKNLFTVTEDGEQNNGGSGNLVISFAAGSEPPTAVTLSPASVTADTFEEYRDGITIQTTVTDGDPNDGARPTLSYTASGTCSIDSASSLRDGGFSGATATATDKVTLGAPGANCIITATPREGVDGTPAIFTIVQQQIAPRLTLPSGTVSGTAGINATFDVTAIKQDNGGTTVAFASSFVADGCTITSDILRVPSGYASAGDTAVQTYTANYSGTGTCTIQGSSFFATEDTFTTFGVGSFDINFAASLTPPTVVTASPASVTANTVAQYRDGITIETAVTDTDPNDGVRPTLSYTTSSANECSVSDETLSGYDSSGVANATAKVNLLSAGANCIVTVTPNEQVGGTAATFTIFQINVAPLLTIPDTASGTVGSAATFTVTATKQDAGFASVTFADSFTADGCVITRGSATTTGGYNSTDDTSVQTYTATRAAGAGSCDIPKRSFSASEDGGITLGLSGNLVISFSASSTPPSVTAAIPFIAADDVANYTNGITITTIVTDNDPNDGERPTLSYEVILGACTIDSDSSLQPSDFDLTGDTATVTDTVTLGAAGVQCDVRATPNEDVDGSPVTFVINTVHVAPLVAVSAVSNANPIAGNSVTVDVTATKQDTGAATVTFAGDFNVGSCGIRQAGSPQMISGVYNATGNQITQQYTISSSTATTCNIQNSQFYAEENLQRGNGGNGVTTVSFAASDSLIFGNATEGVKVDFAPRTATITVTTESADHRVVATANRFGSGCVINPTFATGTTSHTFTVTQRNGSAGYLNCVDVGEYTNVSGATGGSISIEVQNSGSATISERLYADHEIPFAPAEVELALTANDSNIISSRVNENPLNIATSHIYNFLDARRWIFNAVGNNLRSSVIYRGVNGLSQSALSNYSMGPLGYYFDNATGLISEDSSAVGDAIGRAFFVKPGSVPSYILNTDYQISGANSASLADNNYTATFFNNLTDYGIDGYLKFSSVNNVNLSGGSGAFALGLATSANSTTPLIGITTSGGFVTSGFDLKSRICRISTNSNSLSRMHIAALNGKALSCDTVAPGELLADYQAARIISLTDWTIFSGSISQGGSSFSCPGAGTQVWSSNTTIYESFCGSSISGGTMNAPYTGDTIRWSFQQYFGTRAGGAPASMVESGIYLAEVYPVPAGRTNLNVLLGKPVRILFEVLTQ
ncbi:MAG: hypothetical protein K0U41_08360 [Gammaproteobacteria bacterium]|nr:hypothetical protein [Gammaproteobacteria bacterium]